MFKPGDLIRIIPGREASFDSPDPEYTYTVTETNPDDLFDSRLNLRTDFHGSTYLCNPARFYHYFCPFPLPQKLERLMEE